MTSTASRLARAPATGRIVTHPSVGLRFDWLSVVFSAWLVGGAYLDGWAHNQLRGQLESFFTPWHAVLYSGFLVYALFLVGAQWLGLRRGAAWSAALPAGYALSLLGVVVFALGGAGDLVWHTLFGVEANVEALLSPTHHLLVIGVALMASGAFRAAWQRDERAAGWRALLPMLLSGALALSIVTFILQGAHPLTYPVSTVHFAPRNNTERDAFQMLGLAQMMLQSALLMGLVMLMVWRWNVRLPFGAFTLLFALNALLMSTQLYQFRLVPAMLVGGLTADLLLAWLRPSRARAAAAYLLALLTPLALYAAYFITLSLTDQLWWRIHSVAGTTFAAGMAGLLVSVLIFLPRAPSESR